MWNEVSSVVRYLQENDEGESAEFNHDVFWPVNGFVLLLLIGMGVWCCCCGGKDFIARQAAGRVNSDRAYQETVLRRIQQEQEAKMETPEERSAKLLQSFQKHKTQLVVQASDIVEESIREPDPDDVEAPEPEDAADEEDLEAGSTENHGYLALRLGQKPLARTVPNCCAVCLCSYEVDDQVVWSSNPDCQHAFHQQCVIDWLVKMQEGTPCPCCRQEFIHIEQNQVDKPTRPVVAFNANVIRFR